MLKQRIVTAAILIPIVLGLLFFTPPYAFLVLTGLITLIGAWEWASLMQMTQAWQRKLYMVLVVLTFAVVIFIPTPYILIFASIWWFASIPLIVMYPRFSDVWGQGTVLRGLMGLVVLVPCLVAINYMRDQNDGVWAILFLFVLIWGADSAAYFAGKKWGKRKLAPLVSPGKSIEGLLGALTFTFLITLIALILCGAPARIYPWGILLSMITVVFSVVGDLFESMIKRRANVKDSGQILPGHGGVLDRIDSLTAAAPIFAAGAWLLGQVLG